MEANTLRSNDYIEESLKVVQIDQILTVYEAQQARKMLEIQNSIDDDVLVETGFCTE